MQSEGQRERLYMLAEEAAEVIVAVNKMLRHGADSINPDCPQDGTNADQLNAEIADFFGVLRGMDLAADPYGTPSQGTVRTAWQKKLRYAHFQEATDER